MNTRFTIVGMLLAVGGLLYALASGGCATTPSRQLHTTIAVSQASATKIVTGPAKGHWQEQDDHPVVIYVILGDDCNHIAFSKDIETEAKGRFDLDKDETLCAMPLRANQTILLHAVLP